MVQLCDGGLHHQATGPVRKPPGPFVSHPAPFVREDVTDTLRSLSGPASQVVHRLTARLAVGDARTVKVGTGMMDLHVEHIGDCPLGPQYSLAHYYEQGGDLIADPDLVVARLADGRWVPVQFQHVFGYFTAIDFADDGSPLVDDAELRRQVEFANGWLGQLGSLLPPGNGEPHIPEDKRR